MRVFNTISLLCRLFVQTPTAMTLREPDKRNVKAESRVLNVAAREDALDVVDSFSNILKYCANFSPEHLVDVSNPTTIKIVKLNGFPPEVILRRQSCTTLHPNNFEKQKVHLVVNIFNDKTFAALDGKPGRVGTAKFVKYVTRMWNILNIKCCDIAVRLNDPDRQKFTLKTPDRFLVKNGNNVQENG